MSDELKACPFCGNQSAVMDWLPSLSGIVEYPFCEYCGAQCETAELWNTRPIEDGLRAELAAAQAEVERLRDMELQADVEHEIWSSWMRYMFTCGTFNDDETWTMPSDKVERWRRQADTPYSELSEREKESDREQVRKHWEAQ